MCIIVALFEHTKQSALLSSATICPLTYLDGKLMIPQFSKNVWTLMMEQTSPRRVRRQIDGDRYFLVFYFHMPIIVFR